MQNTQDKIFKIDDNYAFLTKELLEKEYCENKLTDKQIAQKYNIGSKATVWNRRKFWGIANKYQNKSNKNALTNRSFSISAEDAKSCLEQGLTYVEIANKIGCSRMVAYRRLKEMGLISDQKSTLKKLKWHEPISDLQYRFFLGCLLGDGSITQRGMFQCSHSNKQLEYIQYKRQLVDSLVPPGFNLNYNTIKNHQNGKTYYSYSMRTMQNEHLKAMHDIYYKDQVKIFPYDFLIGSQFDAYSLAIWYMDDGGRRNNVASLYTFAFGYNGNLDVQRFLKNKFGLESELKKDDRPIRSLDCKHFLSLSTDSDKFFQIVAPHILPYFQYKLPEKYRQTKA